MNSPEPITSEQPLTPEILLNPSYRWKTEDIGAAVLDYMADGKAVAQSLLSISTTLPAVAYHAAVMGILDKQINISGGILRMRDYTIAWVDHIRSYPVFYAIKDGKVVISNDARAVANAVSAAQSDETAVLEFVMAGFATGSDTLYRDVKCLQSGEVLIFRTGDAEPVVKRYYQYIPAPRNDISRHQNLAKLSAIIDEIILRIIRRANGRPIWVPLSAGLDSRLILCKLHEHGYKNLHSFTYGPRFNFEALHARRFAQTIGVPWHFIGVPMKNCRQYFQQDERVEYSRFSDGLKAAASLREYVALTVLIEKGLLSNDAILINGQSGDYITGGHVAPFWYENATATEEDLFRVLIDKHYGLWLNLKTPENLQMLKNKIRSVLPQTNANSPMDFAVLEECWEYDARQITLVVNGQRSYDFFGFDWELPLWERDLCDFYRYVPYDQKQRQSLFKEYLKSYDYKGLFKAKEPKIWRWPLPMLWVVPCAQIAGLFSMQAKAKFYGLMRYYGHYSNQYAFFPFSLHLKTVGVARNIFSLYVRNWFVENKFPLPQSLRTAMRLDNDGQ